jgi:CheY-like chemotaxis protein
MRGIYPQYDHMPFIFLTAYTNPEHKEQVKDLNAVAYLNKPVNFDVLFSTVKQALKS